MSAQASGGRARAIATGPTLEVEQQIAAACGPGPRIIVGIDEVGRGALAGPVAMGACAVVVGGSDPTVLPPGVRDSKKLSAIRREQLVEPIQQAAAASAVGMVGADRIDADGIVAALTAAALKALDALDVVPDAVLLDGNADVLSAALAARGPGAPAVHVRVAADRDCASVAAASILAKVQRDALMMRLHEQAPQYQWARNKGYGSAAHREAIQQYGVHEQHRRSWKLTRPAPTPIPGVLWDSGAQTMPPQATQQEESR